MDTLLPIKIPPGLRNTGTVYQSKGRWYTGNFVRFFGDTIQPIGGWAARSLSGATISGVPRAMLSYRKDTATIPTSVLIVGTTTGVYAIVGTTVTDISWSGMANVAARVLQMDVFGGYLVVTDFQAPGTAGATYYWNGNTATDLAVLPDWPGTSGEANLSVVTTPERFLVVLGGVDKTLGYLTYDGTAQDRLVCWADQETGFTLNDFVSTATNTAGSFKLATDGSLVCGRRTRGATLLWTTTDLWTMTYIGGDFIFRFDQAGTRCGIISSHAVAVTDVAAFWMGDNGFFTFDGFVKPLPCEVQDYVFGSLNRTYAHYIWAVENPAFHEITWFYPHAAQTEITRYVTFNYRENHWTYGTLSRTAGIHMQVDATTPVPVMANSSGSIFDHETASARNSEGTPSLESGPVELGNGDRLMQIQRVVPDDKTVGDVNLTVFTAPNPDTAETSNGPYTLTATTSVRLKARQVRLKLTEAVATAWRVGVVRLGVIESSRR